MPNELWDDDGKPIHAKSGRKPKPELSDDEFAAIVPILSKKRGQHGGSLQVAANEISRLRGAAQAVDPRTRASRSVSARWIHMALARRGIAGKTGLREKYQTSSVQDNSGRNSVVALDMGTRLSPTTTPEVLGAVPAESLGGKQATIQPTGAIEDVPSAKGKPIGDWNSRAQPSDFDKPGGGQ